MALLGNMRIQPIPGVPILPGDHILLAEQRGRWRRLRDWLRGRSSNRHFVVDRVGHDGELHVLTPEQHKARLP